MAGLIRKSTTLLLKASAMAIVAAVGFGCLVVSAGAARTQEALEILSKPTPSAKGRALNGLYAREVLERDWSRPLAWSPAAQEAEGWAYALQADGAADPKAAEKLGRAAADWSWRTVKGSPITPTAWVRLQFYANQGYDPAGCRQISCVDRSYIVAPLSFRPALECTRYRMSLLAGRRADDEVRLYGLTHSDIGGDELAQCLSGQDPELIYRALRARRGA